MSITVLLRKVILQWHKKAKWDDFVDGLMLFSRSLLAAGALTTSKEKNGKTVFSLILWMLISS